MSAKSLALRVQEVAEEAKEEIARLEKQRDDIDIQIRVLRRFVQAAAPSPRRQRQRQQRASTGAPIRSVSPDALEIARAIITNPERLGHPFSVTELQGAMGTSNSTASAIVANLRHEGVIYLAERRKQTPYYALAEGDH